ncbi:hypothetical protein M0805_000910 [Coniferiporia weirii]|nr:hypothetical protein M0805_000910 [Coniferiporia weirii]
MSPVHLKLTRPGRETRRASFPKQPSWSVLATRIASLFDISPDNVAVSYEDSDGDIVTLNSNEELHDYFTECHEHGELIKFNVLDSGETRRQTQAGVSSTFVEELNEEAEGGLPTMGPTMVFEVDDTDWQRLPRMPNVFAGPHAFVEVVDSDVAHSRKDSESAFSAHASVRSSSRGSRRRGKRRASLSDDAKSISSVSIIENETPSKPPVHVYDVSDAGGSPYTNARSLGPGKLLSLIHLSKLMPYFLEHVAPQRPSKFGIGVSDQKGSNDTMFPQDGARKPLSKAPSPRHSAASIHSTQATPRQVPAFDLVTPHREHRQLQPTNESSASTFESAAHPSFVGDVANLVDGLTDAFASHPELSEGMRNIVRNAVEGRYLETERDRVAGTTESVRIAAGDASERILRAARDVTAYSERDAVKRIAEALGGVFRVIGELCNTGAGAVPSSSSSIHRQIPPQGLPPSAPFPPPLPHGVTPQGVPPHRPPPDDWHGFGVPHLRDDPFDRYRAEPSFYRDRSHHRRNVPRSDRPIGRFAGPAPPPPPPPRTSHFDGFPVPPQQRGVPFAYEQASHPPQPWAAAAYAPPYHGDSSRESHGNLGHHSIHESKAQLEAAKAVYKAEKDRFRQEKEERRRMRYELAERRAEEGRAARIDGTTRDETIVARIPLPSPSKGGSSNRPYAEVYSVPNQSIVAPPIAENNASVPRRQYTPNTTPSRARASPAGIIPIVPPAPPPAPVLPSTASIPVQPDQPMNAPSAPLPWPVPPSIGASRRVQLSTLRDRILARLFEMGITTSRPETMDILNEHSNRTDANEEDILADVILALTIKDSPSPRRSGSRLAR